MNCELLLEAQNSGYDSCSWGTVTMGQQTNPLPKIEACPGCFCTWSTLERGPLQRSPAEQGYEQGRKGVASCRGLCKAYDIY